MIRPKQNYQTGGLTKGLIPQPTYRMLDSDSAAYRGLMAQAQQLGTEAYSDQYINPVANKVGLYSGNHYLNQLYTRSNALQDSQNTLSPQQIAQELLKAYSRPKDSRKKQAGGPLIDTPKSNDQFIPGVTIPTPVNPPSYPAPNSLQDGIQKGIIAPPNGYTSAQQWYKDMTGAHPPKQPTPSDPWGPYLAMRGTTAALSELSGRADRHRQDQYMYNRLSSLGANNPLPSIQFQPNPYNLYAKYGGKLNKYINLK